MLAVYIIPQVSHPMYRLGSSFLGYDVHSQQTLPPLMAGDAGPGEVEAWIGKSRWFGFHATLGDALEYSDLSIPEVKERLHWIGKRIGPFTLTNGRIHELFRNVPRTLATTYDSPDSTLQNLQGLVVTLINVLYESSPFFDPIIGRYAMKQQTNIIRFGSPFVLDEFDLHFSFGANIPDHRCWSFLRAGLAEQLAALDVKERSELYVQSVELVERNENGFFRIIESVPLTGHQS